MYLWIIRKRVAEEGEGNVTVTESKKLKLETNVALNEPEELPSASISSSEPTIIMEGDAAVTEDEPVAERPHPTPATHTQKPRVADPSFKEMPYTFLSPDDPALVTCV